jgi:hypothetical protein
LRNSEARSSSEPVSRYSLERGQRIIIERAPQPRPHCVTARSPPGIAVSCGVAGHKKAIVAVAHSLLVTAYHVLARHSTHHELGADYDRHHSERAARRAIQTLEHQGYRVTLERVA